MKTAISVCRSRQRSDPESTLYQALNYASLGFKLFPCHSIRDGACSCGKGDCPSPAKHPRTPRGVNDATTDETTIREWFKQWPDANLAIAGGNDLLIIDVDPRHGGDESLAKLEAELGPLPHAWQVATGGGGRHFYVAVPAGSDISSSPNWRPGVDLKYAGGYVIAPPSVHVNGGIYEWSGPQQLPGPLPLPDTWLAALPVKVRRRDGRKASSKVPSTVGRWSRDTDKRLSALIERTKILKRGTRYKRMLQFARGVAAIPELKWLSSEELHPALWIYFEASQGNTDASWDTFRSHWRYLWEQGIDKAFQDDAYKAWEEAKEKPFPELASRYAGEEMKKLIALCAELERQSGAKVWFLSCRKVQDILEIPYPRASILLKQLIRDGVLELGNKKVNGGAKAQRYRYTGDDCIDEPPTIPIRVPAKIINAAAHRQAA